MVVARQIENPYSGAGNTQGVTGDTSQIPETVPAPAFQPDGIDPITSNFSSGEIYWWNNGIWGQCGYAIPNPGGKVASQNAAIHRTLSFIGQELFLVMHKDDVYMSRPPNGEFLADVVKMINLGRKRLRDNTIGWTDVRRDGAHAGNDYQSFVIWPVPYFGGRIRQVDVKGWCKIILDLEGEIMQHSDNLYDNDITDLLTSRIDEAYFQVQYDIATKYLGIDRATAEAPEFVIPADAFAPGNYNPGLLFTERELVEERPPLFWKPKANDLSPINGIPIDVAKAWAARWPDSGEAFYGDGGNFETFMPGDGTGQRIQNPYS